MKVSLRSGESWPPDSAPDSARSRHEIEHGRFLARGDPEAIWGWATPAGRLRLARRAGLIADGAGLRPGRRVLEIGCGTGTLTQHLVEHRASILAIDISDDLLDGARKRALPEDLVRFECRQLESFEPDERFDAVVGSSVLHHLALEPAFRRIFEILKPGGVISFAEPNMLNPQVLAERKLRFVRPLFSHVSPDETAFVRFTLRRRLERFGFREVTITPFDWLHPATPPRWIPRVRRLGRRLEAMPLLRELAGSLYIRAVRPR